MAEPTGKSSLYAERVPCKSCPYRRSVKRAHWAPEEYANLLQQDANEFGGSMFGCHQDRKREPAEQRPCVGWLHNQAQRGFPSIQLRLRLMTTPAAADQAKEVNQSCKGLKLYRSVEEMARANYPAMFAGRGVHHE